ncbi:DUF3606 domain-containing protein [Variovorax paradoxus]|uniref:DUF3606 domain-containing protein n=1 Tax=Variovorax paradoxus TaxID=34073 RepID=UPI001931E69A|nr:DUF3606 domain-containing protein [Variovorax paradoxus]
MLEDPKKVGLDRELISLREPYQLRPRTGVGSCSETPLQVALKAEGNSAEEVRERSKGRT